MANGEGMPQGPQDREPSLPPIDPSWVEPKIEVMRGDGGELHFIDPRIPTDLTVSSVLGEGSAPLGVPVEISEITVKNIRGESKTYNRQTGTWE